MPFVLILVIVVVVDIHVITSLTCTREFKFVLPQIVINLDIELYLGSFLMDVGLDGCRPEKLTLVLKMIVWIKCHRESSMLSRLDRLGSYGCACAATGGKYIVDEDTLTPVVKYVECP